MFSTLHIEVRRLQKTQEDILHVVAHVTGLGQRGGIGNGEGDIQGAGQRLGKEGLAAAGGADHQNIALLQLHIVAAAEIDALIVVVHRHGEGDLGLLLSDDILIQHLFDLTGRGKLIDRLHRSRRCIALLQDGDTQLHALITDAHAGALHHTVDHMLLLAAERAAQRFRCFGVIRHSLPHFNACR